MVFALGRECSLAFFSFRKKLTKSKPWLANLPKFAEISNYITHLNLRSIRTPPGQPRKFPRGYGFELVSVPNYYFELVAWVALCVMSKDLACEYFTATFQDDRFAKTMGPRVVVIFTIVATGQMAVWADKKHRTYKKEHGAKYPRRRMRMIPFIW